MSSTLTLFADASFSKEKGRTLPSKISGVAYSGGRVPDRNIVVDLATTRAAVPSPLLEMHDPERTVGRVGSVRMTDEMTIEGDLYSDVDGRAKLIAEKASRGHPWQLSIGIHECNVEFVPEGQSVNVNGRDFEGPISVFRDGRLREVSVVAIGADPHTSATFLSHQGEDPMGTQQSNEGTANTGGNGGMAQLAAMTQERDSARTELSTVRADLAAKNQEIATLTAERDALRTRLADAERTQRVNDVKAMFSQVGWQFTDDAAKPYLDLPQQTFATLAADIVQRNRPVLPEYLRHQQSGGAAPAAANGADAALAAGFKQRYGKDLAV